MRSNIIIQARKQVALPQATWFINAGLKGGKWLKIVKYIVNFDTDINI